MDQANDQWRKAAKARARQRALTKANKPATPFWGRNLFDNVPFLRDCTTNQICLTALVIFLAVTWAVVTAVTWNNPWVPSKPVNAFDEEMHQKERAQDRKNAEDWDKINQYFRYCGENPNSNQCR